MLLIAAALLGIVISFALGLILGVMACTSAENDQQSCFALPFTVGVSPILPLTVFPFLSSVGLKQRSWVARNAA